MKNAPLLNDLLTKGAILGGVMLLANVAEVALASRATLGLVMLSGLIAVVSWVAFCYLSYRFTKNYDQVMIDSYEGLISFTYVNGVAYVVTVSMLAGVISSLGSYIFLHHIIGYETYINAYIKLINDMLSQAHLPESMVGVYDEMVRNLKSQPVPTLLTSIYSGVMIYSIFGLVAGLIIAIFTRRKSVLIDNNSDE